MAQFGEVVVVRSLVFSVFLWRDDGVHAPTSRLLKNGICIIALVRNQMIRVDPLDQSAGLRAIRSGTFWSNNSDRHTKRIHGQMDLGVEPPLVRLLS